MFEIFNVSTDADACDGMHTGGSADSETESSALKADSERETLRRTGDSNPRQHYALAVQLDALPTELFSPPNVLNGNFFSTSRLLCSAQPKSDKRYL